MKHNRFEGWYFKHQKGDQMVAFIPGRAESGAFVQMITPAGSRQFAVSSLRAARGIIRAGDCTFFRHGCKIDLPGVTGQFRYGAFTPICGDIMGPFRFFPMECRHGVISMGHSIKGKLTIENTVYDFDGGKGYIEKDSGISFPQFYQWLQCNDFERPCSVLISIAHIPFCGAAFTGCICAIMLEGKEYRLATYHGVKIHRAEEKHICLSQGNLFLEAEIFPSPAHHPLQAPIQGQMSATIRESTNAGLRLRLWNRQKLVCDLASSHATYEFVPKP